LGSASRAAATHWRAAAPRQWGAPAGQGRSGPHAPLASTREALAEVLRGARPAQAATAARASQPASQKGPLLGPSGQLTSLVLRWAPLASSAPVFGEAPEATWRSGARTLRANRTGGQIFVTAAAAAAGSNGFPMGAPRFSAGYFQFQFLST